MTVFPVISQRNTSLRRSGRPSRRGFLAPVLGMMVLCTLLLTGLVLNVLWARGAKRGLSSAADAAALAAARELACDERLLDGALPEAVFDRARGRAAFIAGRHFVAGRPAALHADSPPRFGRAVGEQATFLETAFAPDRVTVTVSPTAEGFLPWIMNWGGRRGMPLSHSATVQLESHVAALQPRGGGTVPAWPIALRGAPVSATTAAGGIADSAAAALGSWSMAIDGGLGGDEFSWNSATREIEQRPDGIKELVVRSQRRGGRANEVGFVLADLGQSFQADDLARVLREGLAAEDLAELGGIVPVASLPGSPVSVESRASLPGVIDGPLQPGDARVLFLFRELIPTGQGRTTAVLDRAVVARLMALTPLADGAWEATFQPAVLATGTAVMKTAADAETTENASLWRLRLTN